MKAFKTLLFAGSALVSSSFVSAAIVDTVGSIDTLSDRSQITSQIGTADFELGSSILVPTDTYSSNGLTLLHGDFGYGTAQPRSYDGYANPTFFGSVDVGDYVNMFGGVAVFDDSYSITQFGLDAGRNGKMYMTVWDTFGTMIGQTSWTGGEAGFIGVDTLGVAIGMIAYGNDDLWSGATYNISGATIMSDNWVWGGEISPVPVPAAVWLFGTALIGFAGFRRKQLKAT